MVSKEKRPSSVNFYSPFFYPDPISTGKYNYELVKRFVELDIKTRVFCMYPFYPTWTISSDNLIPREPIPIIRFWKRIRFPKSIILRRVILESAFALSVLINHWKFKSDVMIAVYPPSLFGVMFLGNSTRKRVCIVHDLQAIYAAKKSNVLLDIISMLIKYIEKKAINKNDSVIVLSDEIENYLINEYNTPKASIVKAMPFVTIHPLICKPNPSELINHFKDETLNIVYSGALGEKQNANELFKLFSDILAKRSGIEFIVFSSGPMYERLRVQYSSSRIIFSDLVDEELLAELYWYSDIQVIPQSPGTSKGSLPSKLPNIVASGTNILLFSDHESELEMLILNNHLGVSVKKWDTENIIHCIDELDVMNKTSTKMDRINDRKKTTAKLFSIDNVMKHIY
jgi:colanic acid biosynthesis glycosyl transferase WcaI